jgi:hypothetical protein
LTDESSPGFDRPTPTWLLWGLLAVLALAAMIFFLANLGSGDDPVPESAGQVEWAIDVSRYGPSPGEVTLKGDMPLGFPTETWINGVMMLRSVDARQFEWNMDTEPAVPVPVYAIDQANGCDELNTLLAQWVAQVETAPGEGQQVQAEAFAQHAYDSLLDQGCEPALDQ